MTWSLIALDGGRDRPDRRLALLRLRGGRPLCRPPHRRRQPGVLQSRLGHRGSGGAWRPSAPRMCWPTSWDRDEGRAIRQAHMLDAEGSFAAHTGADCVDWCGHLIRADHSVAGNMLAGPEVIAATSAAYAAATGPFAERLLAAMRAGEAAGGDKRGAAGRGASPSIAARTIRGFPSAPTIMPIRWASSTASGRWRRSATSISPPACRPARPSPGAPRATISTRRSRSRRPCEGRPAGPPAPMQRIREADARRPSAGRRSNLRCPPSDGGARQPSGPPARADPFQAKEARLCIETELAVLPAERMIEDEIARKRLLADRRLVADGRTIELRDGALHRPHRANARVTSPCGPPPPPLDAVAAGMRASEEGRSKVSPPPSGRWVQNVGRRSALPVDGPEGRPIQV